MASKLPILEQRLDVKKRPYFVLKARNGEILMLSEAYSSLRKCIAAMRRIATMLAEPVIVRIQ